MFWDQVAGVYDIFVNVINRKTHQKLKRSNCKAYRAPWKRVRISRDSPLLRLQREISGVLYLQRIAVISSDTAIFTDPVKTHADLLIPMQT